jgi:hypothetical protein
VVLAGCGLTTGSVRHLTSGRRSTADAGSNRSRGVSARRIFSAARITDDVLVTIYIATLAATLLNIPTADEVWCVFDNTARGAAIENACELHERLIVDFARG